MNKKTSIAFIVLFFFTQVFYAQKWITSLEEYDGNVVVDIEHIEDDQYVLLLNGTNPQLVFMQKNGIATNSIMLDNYFGNVYDMTISETDFIIVGSQEESPYVVGVITRLKNDGSLIWTDTYERGFISTVELKDDNILAGGNLDSPGTNSEQLLLMLDPDGNTLWKHTAKFTTRNYIDKILIDDDRVFLVSQCSNVGVGFAGFYVGEFNLSSRSYTWYQRYNTGHFHNIFGNNYNFPFGACLSNNEIVIAFPGNIYGEMSTFYKITKDGEFLEANSLYSNEGVHPHDIQPFDNGDFLIVGSYQGPSSISNVVERRGSNGQLIWQKKFETGTLLSALLSSDQIILGGMTESYYINDQPRIPLIASITEDGVLYNSGISISLKMDETNMCGINGAVENDEDVIFHVGNEEFTKTDSGKYVLDLPTGEHILEYEIPDFLETCDWPATITVDNEENLEIIELVTNVSQCADLYVGITKTELLKDQPNLIYVEYQNKGNIDVDNAYIVLRIDGKLEFINASVDYEFIDDNNIKLLVGPILSRAKDRISISLQAKDDVSVFTNLNIEAEIFPHSNCKDIDDDLSHFDILSSCDDGEMTFQIVNRGGDMQSPGKFAILIDGYHDSDNTFQLESEMSQTVSLDLNGQAGTIQIYQGQNVIKSYTYEGCGKLSNGYSTVAVASQLNENINLPFIDNSILELRTNHTDSRLFQSNNGRGRYHFIKPDFEQSEFIIRYVNDDDEPIEELTSSIGLPTYSFRHSAEIMASSHEITSKIKGGNLVITSQEPIAPHTEFQCKYTLSFDPNIEPNELLISSASFGSKNRKVGNENIAFNNTSDDLNFDTASPFAEIDDGHIFGKNDGIDFSSDLVVLGNGDKIATTVVNENTVGYILTLNKFDKFEQFLWTKDYKFDHANPIIRDVELLNDGNIMIVGNLDDKNLYQNFQSDVISFFLVIDKNGKEIYRSRNFLNEIPTQGSLLSGALALDDGNILLIGYKFQSGTGTFFNMLLNPQYQRISYGNLNPPSGLAPFYGSQVVKNNSCISLISLNTYSTGPNYSAFILSRKNGTVYNSNLFTFTIPGGLFNPNRSYVHEDGSVLNTGIYYESQNNEIIDYYYSIMEFDKDQKFVRKFEVLQDAYSYTISSVMKNDGTYLVAGSYNLDSLSNSDAYFMEVDSSGNVLWMIGEDMGAEEECTDIFIGPNKNVYATFQTQAADFLFNLQAGYLYGPENTVSTHEISNQTNQFSILVYPNPTTDNLYVKTNDIKYTKFRIMSMTGKTEMMGSYYNDCLDVSALTSSNYVLILTQENGKRVYSNFIKI